MPDHLVRFYCDAATGMFWLYVTNTSTGAHTGALVATSLRRYPADTTQGLLCRYGLLEARLSRQFLPAYYADNTTGAKSSACQFELWSPLLGDDRGLSPKRHPASPMPAMSAPVFIQAAANATSACMPGELERVQMLPDGDYTCQMLALARSAWPCPTPPSPCCKHNGKLAPPAARPKPAAPTGPAEPGRKRLPPRHLQPKPHRQPAAPRQLQHPAPRQPTAPCQLRPAPRRQPAAPRRLHPAPVRRPPHHLQPKPGHPAPCPVD